MPPVAGLVLGLAMNGVATGGGTYPDDTCKEGEGEGREAQLEGQARLSSLPCLSYSAVPYPGFEGIIPGHVIQQRGQRVDLQINTAHLLPRLEGQGSKHPSHTSSPTSPPSGQRGRGGQR